MPARPLPTFVKSWAESVRYKLLRTCQSTGQDNGIRLPHFGGNTEDDIAAYREFDAYWEYRHPLQRQLYHFPSEHGVPSSSSTAIIRDNDTGASASVCVPPGLERLDTDTGSGSAVYLPLGLEEWDSDTGADCGVAPPGLGNLDVDHPVKLSESDHVAPPPGLEDADVFPDSAPLSLDIAAPWTIYTRTVLLQAKLSLSDSAQSPISPTRAHSLPRLAPRTRARPSHTLSAGSWRATSAHA
eukprot:GEMP01028330.1.p1 GENE.GEMP01028330.1~~GEMP01028330.1.p1  ORF type:complete len:241 (+),score=53.73 GEMP01028330.1:117-839(+)